MTQLFTAMFATDQCLFEIACCQSIDLETALDTYNKKIQTNLKSSFMKLVSIFMYLVYFIIQNQQSILLVKVLFNFYVKASKNVKIACD